MAGLQGVGKTTACGKLALALQKRNKKVPSCMQTGSWVQMPLVCMIVYFTAWQAWVGT